MALVITTGSILVITGLAWLLNKVLPFKVCPICAGVSGTWFLLLIGILSGVLLVTSYQLLVSILMGGTVVGIAYQGEKSMGVAPENFLKFRTATIVPGFILVYFAVNNISWLTLVVEAVALAAVTYLYFVLPFSKSISSPRDNQKIAELEEKMKNCC
ncbi:MAG: hypothetical protein UY26_C0002G0065 [Candidatus Jorgensenbacteria bacterium GW2011_GWA1_48_13]|uniref:Uncharacterized protein n=1 Tax=Candidatus Jorgensenbacteria bacterium GW2011_GWB1_50_10 TaxID=1618665 RepID=A0A0G1WA03_9BACT|nr:MAG: hypothetical protein UX26_C0014G0002 [Parcubacteria group bacterium GW2011_GWC1_45_9]KKU94283.1 MAG: hypothetical protein UY26_C0002G0065 [Candidatus Jorgensenbacteria bacterium GW2011_GWA1_48_13]KKW15445.1 MAG: hypothetical protein UY55_C0001G0199 [Candidatus Jorgensenbacteria bacterium GW2011_GWB1_50_10]